MDVKEFFSEPWFWDKHYEVFSEEELSQIEVLSEEETHTIWYEYCDNETLAYCWFVKKIVDHTLPLLCVDCGWGEDETEKKTGHMLREELEKQLDGTVSICYTDTRGVRVPVRLFCDKWYEFCFLAIYDDILLDLGENALLYYETDHLYILEKRTSKDEENVTQIHISERDE